MRKKINRLMDTVSFRADLKHLKKIEEVKADIGVDNTSEAMRIIIEAY